MGSVGWLEPLLVGSLYGIDLVRYGNGDES
jgi:hypothetical protein